MNSRERVQQSYKVLEVQWSDNFSYHNSKTSIYYSSVENEKIISLGKMKTSSTVSNITQPKVENSQKKLDFKQTRTTDIFYHLPR